MPSQSAYEFDYYESLEAEGGLLPFKKLTEAVAADLTELSDRASQLEGSIAQSLINGGALMAVAAIVYWLGGGPAATFFGIPAIYAWRNIPSYVITRRRAVADIGAFENRLSEKNFGVKWDSLPDGRRMNVRIFWRDGAEERA